MLPQRRTELRKLATVPARTGPILFLSGFGSGFGFPIRIILPGADSAPCGRRAIRPGFRRSFTLLPRATILGSSHPSSRINRRSKASGNSSPRREAWQSSLHVVCPHDYSPSWMPLETIIEASCCTRTRIRFPPPADLLDLPRTRLRAPPPSAGRLRGVRH